MDERTEALIARLENWAEAYPPDIFTPLRGDPIDKTGDYDTAEKRTLITQASSQMGRHMIARALKPAIEEIKLLAAELDETREAIKSCSVGPCPVLAHFGLKNLV